MKKLVLTANNAAFLWDFSASKSNREQNSFQLSCGQDAKNDGN